MFYGGACERTGRTLPPFVNGVAYDFKVLPFPPSVIKGVALYATPLDCGFSVAYFHDHADILRIVHRGLGAAKSVAMLVIVLLRPQGGGAHEVEFPETTPLFLFHVGQRSVGEAEKPFIFSPLHTMSPVTRYVSG